MGRIALDKAARKRVREIADALAIVRLDDMSGVSAVLPAIKDLIGLETTGIYSVRNMTGQWSLERWETSGSMTAAHSMVRRLFETTSQFPLFYDPASPPQKGQRNKVVDALAWIEREHPGAWERSGMCERVLRPLSMGAHHQPRALLYDGPRLIAWFGGLHPVPPTARQLQLLQMLVEPMRRRLVAEARLRESVYAPRALEVALDCLGSPAFVIGARGLVELSNAAGRVLLEEKGTTLTKALHDAVAGRCTAFRVELIPIDDGDHRPLWLAVLPNADPEARIAAAVDCCKQRWGLTPKQAEVLGHVARGLSNSAIASLLQCVERTVELHVTALLDRACVDSRSALVSKVLTSSL